MINVNDFIKAMNFLLDKPGMYGVNSVEDIYNFVSAEIFFNRNKAVEEWSDRFTDFTRDTLNNSLSHFHWYKLIRLYSGSDAHSIQLFRDLYMQFQENSN